MTEPVIDAVPTRADGVNTPPRRDGASPRPALLTVIVGTLVAFATSLRGGFVWDDIPLVADNPRLLRPGALWHAFRSHVWDVEAIGASDARRYYRPLVTDFFVVVRRVAGASAWPYHAALLALHVVAIVLCARFLRRATGPNALAITAGTTLFALHASRSDSVSWISGVGDVLATIPILAALTESCPTPEPSTRSRITTPGGILAISLSTAAALLAKEGAITLPLAVFVVAFSTHAGGDRLRAALAKAAASGAVALVYLVCRAVWMPLSVRATSPPLGSHALLALESIGRYAGALVWPWPLTFLPTSLTLDQGAIRVDWPYTVLGGLVSIAVVGLMLSALRRRALSPALAGVFVFVTFLVPVANIVWIGYPYLVAYRFLYAPVVGLSMALSALVAQWVPAEPATESDRESLSLRARRVRLLVIGFAMIHGASIAVRGLDFGSDYAFWASEVEMHPDVPLALRSLGAAEELAGRPGRAFALLRRAHELQAQRQGFRDDSAAAEMLFELVRTGASAYGDDAVEPLEETHRYAADVLANRPGSASIRMHDTTVTLRTGQLARYLRDHTAAVLDVQALTLSRLGRHDEAIAAAQRAMAHCGERCFTNTRTLAVISARAGRWREALEAITRAGQLGNPDEIAPLRAAIVRGSRLAPDDALGRARIDLDLGAAGLALATLARVPPSSERARLVAEALLVEGHTESARRWLGRVGAVTSADVRALREAEILTRARVEGLPTAPTPLAPPPWE